MQAVCCSNLLSVVFYSKDHWELTITWNRRSSGALREEAGSHRHPPSASAHPIHWLVRSPHEETPHPHLQGHWCLCYLYHVFPLPMWAELYISPIELKQPRRALFCGVFAHPVAVHPHELESPKCSHAVLQESYPRYTPYACVYCGLTCLHDHPIWPPRNSANIAVLHPVTPEWNLLPCTPPPPTSGQPHHPTVSAWVNGPWGRAECVCGGSLTVTLWLVSSVEITMDSNSEGSEGNPSPVKEDVYYGSVARRRIWRSMSSEDQYGMWCSYSPRWQFTLTMSEKAKNRSWTHAVISWWSLFCAGQLTALFSLA